MTYFKQINESGELILLLTYDYPVVIDNPFIIEIAEEEYHQLLNEITAHIDTDQDDEISDTEALNIIVGGEEQ